ncbi:MAG: citryl-CoA lyase [Burkholderiaceae bacterium]|nr:citryl-CoA lyase [Burkholderiaceae bacterium]
MRIGKQDNPFTAICTSDAHSITVRGKDLCDELIGQMGFTEYFYFLLTGQKPSESQQFFIDAVLLSISEHGLVPSVQAARMTYAAAPDALQGAVAAGILGCGSVVLGSTEACGRFLISLVDQVKQGSGPAETVAIGGLRQLWSNKQAIPGFGHPQHSEGDPRAIRLLTLAKERGVAGDYIQMLYAVEQAIGEVLGKPLPINVSGAIPAVLLDIGFPVHALKGIPILARTASLIAHLNEEATRPIGFIMSGIAAQGIQYDGN